MKSSHESESGRKQNYPAIRGARVYSKDNFFLKDNTMQSSSVYAPLNIPVLWHGFLKKWH